MVSTVKKSAGKSEDRTSHSHTLSVIAKSQGGGD